MQRSTLLPPQRSPSNTRSRPEIRPEIDPRDHQVRLFRQQLCAARQSRSPLVCRRPPSSALPTLWQMIGCRSVNDCAAPLCSWLGATMLTVANPSYTSASCTQAGTAWMPSSLVKRIWVMVLTILTAACAIDRSEMQICSPLGSARSPYTMTYLARQPCPRFVTCGHAVSAQAIKLHPALWSPFPMDTAHTPAPLPLVRTGFSVVQPSVLLRLSLGVR